MIYQILGWPRSRTAWLANFLTYGHSFCFHEAVAMKSKKRLRTVQEYRKLFKLYLKKYKYIGDSNTVALLYQKYVIPSAKIVIIERDKQEIVESVYGLGYHVEIPKVIEYPYNEQLIIKYDEIDDNLKDIWRFCIPDIQYSKEREVLLKNLNVQVQNVEDYLNYKMGV